MYSNVIRFVVMLFVIAISTFAQSRASLELLGTYKTGSYNISSAEIVAHDPASQQLYVIRGNLDTLDIVSIANPKNPIRVKQVTFKAHFASASGANSVAVRNGIVAVAVGDTAAVNPQPGKVLFFDTAGNYLSQVTVGALPDMLTFNQNGTKVIVANEGEPSASYTNDPEGSVSIIDVSSGAVSATVQHVTFSSLNGQEASLRSQGVRIYGPNATTAKDFEPEYITTWGDTAWVTLQENNAIAIIRISDATLLSIKPLGFKNHLLTNNKLDVSDRDNAARTAGAINIANWPVFGMYLPDAIASYKANGQVYIVTANEGDSRDYAGYTEEARVSTLNLDTVRFPIADSLKLNHKLGRLTVTKSLGDGDGDGDYDSLFALGGRSFTIRDANGTLVFDSGDDFEKITAAMNPAFFNASNTNNTFDSRSTAKGPEPEALTIGRIGDSVYAYIGFERIGGIMVYNITNPLSPSFVQYINNRDFTKIPGAGTVNTIGDLGPEGIIFVPAPQSPINRNLVIVANEISGTVSIFQTAEEPFVLTVLHNNDGESKLVNAGSGSLSTFGGIARFKTLVDTLRNRALRPDSIQFQKGVVLVSSGDNFLAGPEFNASLTLPAGTNFYDGIGLDSVGYDAMAIGNHEFDFGPDVLANFMKSFKKSKTPFISANLGFTNEPNLKVLVDSGRIRSSIIVHTNGQRIGIVGATTPMLPFVTSPRNTIIDTLVAEKVQKEVDTLLAHGVNKIILISHLQSIKEDSVLCGQLKNIDIMIAGGGSEVLANPGTLLVTGETISRGYPLLVNNKEGKSTPIVTTSGDYRYVGKIVVRFDPWGNIEHTYTNQSGPVRVAGGNNPDSVTQNAGVVTNVIVPVQNAIAAQAANIIGTSTVALDGIRDNVRTRETNEGNLVADAILWQAQKLASTFGVDTPAVALQNGGGIRNNSIVAAGNISELTTFSILPFTNFTAIIPSVPPAQFKEILENAVSRVEFSDGRFAQIAGFTFVWDSSGTAQILDANGVVTKAGTRVRSVTLNSKVKIVENGTIVPGAPNITVASIDFLAKNGDQYPFRKKPFTTLGVTYQTALFNYIKTGLAGQVTAGKYPAGGEGRISRSTTTSVGTINSSVPHIYSLDQNYPNPFNPTSTITFTVEHSGITTVKVFDILGKEVATVFNDVAESGRRYQTAFNGSRLSSGIYFYRMTSGNYVSMKKMVLLK